MEIAMDGRERILVDATDGIVVFGGISRTAMRTFAFWFSAESLCSKDKVATSEIVADIAISSACSSGPCRTVGTRS